MLLAIEAVLLWLLEDKRIVKVSPAPKSNTKKRGPGTNCTEIALIFVIDFAFEGWRYAMCGTDIAYGTMRRAVLTSRMVPGRIRV